ncbi:hypothetical protein [Ancylobacter radicis]|uniref:WYL domain-containing protein n=1 Tax=Ancylobacter radicis TaxID=2836179 RepID=A0ABS5R3N2_9HYPH|nr:hypothetical protein [Ancylobacter radicis]MBS9476260.1 hypothetical protein [Ancylobacter radicis]
MKILQYDETESGPRIRKTLVDKHNIEATLVTADIEGTRTAKWTQPKIDLYSYTRPSNGQHLWLIEAEIFFPPDVVLYRGWVLDARPSDEQVRDIVARDKTVGEI